MNLDRYKTKIIQQVRNIQDEKLLNEIDTILLNNRVVAFTTDANSLSKNQYINHIETISDNVANGARTFTSEEVRNKILTSK